jgi:hypothetical protein
MPPLSLKIEFMLEKEYPAAVRYAEVVPITQMSTKGEAKIGSFYMRKTALKGGVIPRRLKMTLEAL